MAVKASLGCDCGRLCLVTERIGAVGAPRELIGAMAYMVIAWKRRESRGKSLQCQELKFSSARGLWSSRCAPGFLHNAGGACRGPQRALGLEMMTLSECPPCPVVQRVWSVVLRVGS